MSRCRALCAVKVVTQHRIVLLLAFLSLVSTFDFLNIGDKAVETRLRFAAYLDCFRSMDDLVIFTVDNETEMDCCLSGGLTWLKRAVKISSMAMDGGLGATIVPLSTPIPHKHSTI